MRKTLMALTIAGIMGGLPATQAAEGHDYDGGKSMSHEEHSHDAGMKHDDHGGMKHDDHGDMKHDDHGDMKHDDHGGMKHGDHGGMKHDDHGDMKHEEHAKDGHKMDGMFLKKKQIDGYTVSFHVMKPADGPSMGGSHHFMVKVERDGKPIEGIVMNTKVVYPDGKDESKKTMKMGDWHMAGYNMQDGKKHQLMILFKTADGEKHKGGVYYP